jgi:hypothetical protein
LEFLNNLINSYIKRCRLSSCSSRKEIVLNLGYSHPVKIEIPNEISVEVVQNTTINLKSCDKELLGYLQQILELGVDLNLIKEKEFYIKMNKLFVKLVNLQNSLISYCNF